jgi:hypothetical protein
MIRTQASKRAPDNTRITDPSGSLPRIGSRRGYSWSVLGTPGDDRDRGTFFRRVSLCESPDLERWPRCSKNFTSEKTSTIAMGGKKKKIKKKKKLRSDLKIEK